MKRFIYNGPKTKAQNFNPLQKFDLSPKSVETLEDTLDIYCTVDELRQRIEALDPEVKTPDEKSSEDQEYHNEKNLKLDLNKNTLHFNFIEGKRDSYQVC